MTLLLIDGFDHADSGIWTANSGSYTTGNKRTGTRAVSIFTGVGAGPMYRDLDSSQEDDGITVGFGVYFDQNALSTSTILSLWEGFSSPQHVRLVCVGGSRGWLVELGDGTDLIATQPNIWFRNTWHYVELGVKVAASGGTVELRQDGVTRAVFAGDTANGGTDQKIDRIRFDSDGHGTVIDDVYILNEQGASLNTFLGDTRMYPLYPNGNGNYSDLVGSDANSTDNYLLVDEVGPASEADYVGSTVDGDMDTYTFEDLPVTVGTIHAVDVRMHAWKTDAGAKSIRSVVRRSGTDTIGADIPLAVTGSPLQELYTQDPVAAADWTISSVNDSEFGAEVRP